MRKLRHSISAFILAVALLLQSLYLPIFAQGRTTVTDNNGTVTIATQNYTVRVAKNGFRYGFYRPDGSAIADMHPVSGIRFGKAGGTLYDAKGSTYIGLTGDIASFEVTNTNGTKADVQIELFEHYVRFAIAPQKGTTALLESTLPKTMVLGDFIQNISVPSDEAANKDAAISSSAEGDESIDSGAGTSEAITVPNSEIIAP
ncbi:hypothetical protein, partial [Hydrogenoanaerobacterium sp.]|uniref:hypothetical protein n=1 Tax=Hydrogenoanaerobacterium sp. TaxID=2953763 RepID=UPI00289B229A